MHLWHIVPSGRIVGLFHKALDAVTDTRPGLSLTCSTCLTAYRHIAAAPVPRDQAAAHGN